MSSWCSVVKLNIKAEIPTTLEGTAARFIIVIPAEAGIENKTSFTGSWHAPGRRDRNSACHFGQTATWSVFMLFYLIAAPSLHNLSAHQIVNIYAKRMQIEQSFRDLKCERFGCAFYYSRTRKPARIAMLLLIHALASFFAWKPPGQTTIFCIRIAIASGCSKIAVCP